VLSTLVVAVLAAIWYYCWSLRISDWPGGASLPGFTFGVVGGLICLFELLLWWRKRVRVWRIGRAQVWMRAHIWLGLLSVPLLVMHSGFRLGGQLAAVLMILFLIVIASGIWGLVFQQLLPKKILADVPAETIYSQIDHVVEQMSMEAERLVLATCGAAPGEATPTTDDDDTATGFLTLGALRSAGKVQGKVLQTIVPGAPVPDTEILRDFYLETIKPYLRKGRAVPSPLASPNQAEILFRNLRTNLDPAAHDAVNALENACEQRRQLDVQARLTFWLHCWLWVHLPLSVALILLMFVHAFKASMYW
jgi:hypothetical protein